MTPPTYVHMKQRLWALRRGLPVDERGYTSSPDDNLFEPLNPAVKEQFNDADGGELKPGKDRLPKMQALHSSSALAINVFHYWKDRDKTPVAKGFFPDRFIDGGGQVLYVCVHGKNSFFSRHQNFHRYSRTGLCHGCA